MPNNTPEFFSQAPTITVHDELADFLGSCQDGLITYNYSDAVKLAGHSCPTVAATYLITRAALLALYPDSIAERGKLKVEWRDSQKSGVTGVKSQVASLITGAAGDNGFSGLSPRFVRRNLLSFDAPIENEVRFTRMDNQQSVEVSANLESVPMHPVARALMPKCLAGQASHEELKAFGQAWQTRVRTLLLEHADDAQVIRVVDA